MPGRIQYPSDITEQQWQFIESILPPDRERGRDRATDLREVINGINYRWKTGCVWRMLPHDFPPWPTIYTYFQRWQRDGTLKQIRNTLLKRRTDSNFSHPFRKTERIRNMTTDSYSRTSHLSSS